jgi:hypothetical protein
MILKYLLRRIQMAVRNTKRKRQEERERKKPIINKPSVPVSSERHFERDMVRQRERQSKRIGGIPEDFKPTGKTDARINRVGQNYQIEIDGVSRILTPQEWKNLGEIGKFGALAATSEKATQVNLAQEELQKKKEAKFEQPKNMFSPELPEVEAEKRKRSLFWQSPIVAPIELLPEGSKLKSDLQLKAAAAFEIVKSIPLLGAGMRGAIRAGNYQDWYNIDRAKQTGSQAAEEFVKIINDVMIGGESEIGAKLRWERAKNMLSAAISNTQQIIKENPIYFKKEGEELAFELEQIRINLAVKANILDRVILASGSGRREIARELGLPEIGTGGIGEIPSEPTEPREFEKGKPPYLATAAPIKSDFI